MVSSTTTARIRLFLLLAASLGTSSFPCTRLPSTAVVPCSVLVPLTTRFVVQNKPKTKQEPTAFHPFLVENTNDSYETQTNNDPETPELSLWAARALLLLVAAIWATNFASVKYLENLCFHPPCHHLPSEAALARFGVAALVSLPLLIGKNKSVILAGLECGISVTLGYVSQALALSTISSGKCAFICSLTVVFVPIVAAVMYGKPIKPATILAGVVALTGVGVLEGMIDFQSLLGIEPAAAQEALLSSSSSLTSVAPLADGIVSSSMEVASGPIASLAHAMGVSKGDILALGQPIGFGYSFLRIEHYQEKFERVENRVLTIAAAQCVCVGFLSLLWVLYDFHGVIPDFGYMIEPHRLATIGWTGIITTVVAIFMEGIALQKASATDASIAFSTEPVFATIFAFFLLGEQLGLNSYVGGFIIMSACLIGAIADLQDQQKSKKELESLNQ